jgi:hypothetical protein
MTTDSVIREIADERQRQIESEGWTLAHDDGHVLSDLAQAAAAYAQHAGCQRIAHDRCAPECWPWDYEWWRPKGDRRDLMRAAALIVAEIERLDRAAEKEGEK